MVVARRYARALYEDAEAVSKTSAVDDDMTLVSDALDASDELARFFRSPVISRDRKKQIARSLFADRVDELTLDFLEMLVRKQREDIFPRIADAYRVLRNEQLGVVEATARSARDLSVEEQEELATSLGRLTGKKVKLHVETDERLIGGVVIRVGDTVYDGSVRHQLNTLRDQMQVGAVSLN